MKTHISLGLGLWWRIRGGDRKPFSSLQRKKSADEKAQRLFLSEKELKCSFCESVGFWNLVVLYGIENRWVICADCSVKLIVAVLEKKRVEKVKQ